MLTWFRDEDFISFYWCDFVEVYGLFYWDGFEWFVEVMLGCFRVN
jgi:hypothetical protein